MQRTVDFHGRIAIAEQCGLHLEDAVHPALEGIGEIVDRWSAVMKESGI